MADTPETKIKKEIREYTDSLGPLYWDAPFHNVGYARKGIMDRLACYRGVFIGLEVKAPGKKPTPWQEREIEAVRAAGGVAEVVYCVQDVMKIIAQIDHLTGVPVDTVTLVNSLLWT